MYLQTYLGNCGYENSKSFDMKQEMHTQHICGFEFHSSLKHHVVFI